MNLTCTHNDTKMVISVRMRRIDAENATFFKDRLREMITAAELPVVIDMRQVTFIDSSGLGALISVQKTLVAGQGLELNNLSAEVRRVFQKTGMNELFHLPTIDTFSTHRMNGTGHHNLGAAS